MGYIQIIKYVLKNVSLKGGPLLLICLFSIATVSRLVSFFNGQTTVQDFFPTSVYFTFFFIFIIVNVYSIYQENTYFGLAKRFYFLSSLVVCLLFSFLFSLFLYYSIGILAGEDKNIIMLNFLYYSGLSIGLAWLFGFLFMIFKVEQERNSTIFFKTFIWVILITVFLDSFTKFNLLISMLDFFLNIHNYVNSIGYVKGMAFSVRLI